MEASIYVHKAQHNSEYYIEQNIIFSLFAYLVFLLKMKMHKCNITEIKQKGEQFGIKIVDQKPITEDNFISLSKDIIIFCDDLREKIKPNTKRPTQMISRMRQMTTDLKFNKNNTNTLDVDLLEYDNYISLFVKKVNDQAQTIIIKPITHNEMIKFVWWIFDEFASSFYRKSSDTEGLKTIERFQSLKTIINDKNLLGLLSVDQFVS